MEKLIIKSAYNPKPTQREFHACPALDRGFKGSKGSGKSRTLVEESIALAYEWPGNRGIIARLDLEDLKETTMHIFFDSCPEQLIVDRNRAEHWVMLKSKDPAKPSRIKFAHCKDPKSFESGEIGFFATDETDEIPEETVKTLRSRRRLKGVRLCGMMVFNPPSKIHWLHRFFVEDIQEKPDLGAQRVLFSNNTYENQDNLPPHYIEELKQIYSGDELKRFLLGEWGSTSSDFAVMQEWRSSIHLAKERLKPIMGLPVFRSWDFGMSAACLFSQLVEGQLRVLMEINEFNMGADTFAPMVQAYSAKNFPNYQFLDYSDPTFIRNREQVSAKTVADILRTEHRIYLQDGAIEWAKRLEAVNWFLTRQIKGEPAMVVDPSCRTLIAGCEGQYKFRDKATERKAEDVVKNEFSHIQDCLQHTCVKAKEMLLKSERRIVIPKVSHEYAFTTDL